MVTAVSLISGHWKPSNKRRLYNLQHFQRQYLDATTEPASTSPNAATPSLTAPTSQTSSTAPPPAGEDKDKDKDKDELDCPTPRRWIVIVLKISYRWCDIIQDGFLLVRPKKWLSVRLHSKSHQQSSKCQNFLRVWHLVIVRADQKNHPAHVQLRLQ